MTRGAGPALGMGRRTAVPALSIAASVAAMPVDQSLVGKAFPPTEPFTVTAEHVQAFVESVGGEYAGGPAPATYPIVLAFDAMNAFLEAERVELHRIVHGEQRFAYERPVVPGDVLTARLTVASLRQIAGNDIIGTTQRGDRRRRRARLLDVGDPGAPGGRRMTLETPDLHRDPRRPGALRRGGRRPQPDPPGRGGRAQRRAARASSRTACTRWRWPRARWRAGSPAPRWSASAASSPTRSLVPAEGAAEIEFAGEASEGEDGTTTIKLTVTCAGREGARDAQGSRACPLRWLSCSRGTPRSGSAAPPGAGCARRPRRS